MIRVAFVVALGARLFVGATSLQGQTTAEARKAYEDFLRANTAMNIKGDAAGIAAMYTPDALIIGPQGYVTRGSAALQRDLTGAFKDIAVKSLTSTIADFGSNGPLAYASGTDVIVYYDKKSKKQVTDSTHFVVIFKQGADKHWRVHYDLALTIPSTKS